MLYGNIIFIKKTGGDGSKYPVTERDIKIGRSEECLIRIYNPQVAPEHCQLIIEENGQATLRNLSNQTILNGKPSGHKDVVLCHGDVFKLGERLARWEYLPTSKYYRQLLSPTGRLVAVVMPQQRPLGEQKTSRASVSQVTVSRCTPLGKRRYSERVTGESSSAVKMRKSSGSELISRNRGTPMKFLTGRHSLKTTKVMLKGGKLNERKSNSGIISSRLSKGKVLGKSRKSTLPQWKVNIASPPGKVSPSGRSSLKKSQRESLKSPKSAVKTPSKKIKESEPSEKYLSASKAKMRTPQKALIDISSSEESPSSTSRNVSKTPLKTVIESQSKSGRGSSKSAPRGRKSSLKSPSKLVFSTPKPKSPKHARLVQSESKMSSALEKRSSISKQNRKMSLLLEKLDFSSMRGLSKTPVSGGNEDSKIKMSEVVSSKNLPNRGSIDLIDEASVKKKTSPRKSARGTPVQKTPRKSKGGVRKSSTKRTPGSIKTVEKMRNSTKTAAATEKHSRTPRISSTKKRGTIFSQGDTSLVSSENSPSMESPSALFKNTPVKKTPAKSDKNTKKTQSPSPSRKITVNQNSSADKSSPVRSPRRKQKISTIEGTVGEPSKTSEPRITSPRGIQRKLSPSSSAEIAAKKLKTSSPRKPDKNKKAALLVLGKANRRHLHSQNVKVLLKQKIVKKALKQSSAVQKEGSGKIAPKLKPGLRKRAKTVKNVKSKKSTMLRDSSGKFLPSNTSKLSGVIADNSKQENTPKSKKVPQGNQLSTSKVLQTPSRVLPKSKSPETTPKSISKQKKSESSFKTNSESSSPSISFQKNAESYLLNSLRRCSKRLSSKNDTGRPDFIELSPTALGLMPKNLEIFKTPKDYKRRSSSLVTPKNIRTTGIIKSASTSKVANRKSVRFSPKDISYNSTFPSPNLSEKIEFDFSSFHTPNITMDVFVSPLSEKSSVTKKNESELFIVEKGISKSSSKNSRQSTNLEPKLAVRKLLQSPQSRKSSDLILSHQNAVLQSPKSLAAKLTSPVKVSSDNKISDFGGFQQLFETPKTLKSPKSVNEVSKSLQTSKVMKSPKNDSIDLMDLQTPKGQKSRKKDLTDAKGVNKLLATPRTKKSPKNDLTDVRGVKKLLRTPKVQKSPKNDLTDIKGVKKLLATPRTQKSPKNDLTDVGGVKKLLRTPKVPKSPKNDLTDVRGVKQLLRTPKVQKSPKNDLTDVRGVKKLLRTPKVQKSPKNDLTDVRGVKKLLATPKTQKSPKNDLTDVRGVKKLLATPKTQKSPKNDLTDVRGVKRLLATPKTQKSPKNDLTDVRGVKKLLRTPKVQKSPKNDLTDVRGVKKLLATPKTQKSPKYNLLDISLMTGLFESPAGQNFTGNATEKLLHSPQLEKSLGDNFIDLTEVKELLSKSLAKEGKSGSRKSRVKDFRAIRGRRTIKSTPKGPKNDLSDVMGVRELFLRHQPPKEQSVDLTGIAELFNLNESKVISKKRTKKTTRKSDIQVPETRPLKRRKMLDSEDGKDDNLKVTTRGGRSRKVAVQETEKKTRSVRSKTAVVEEKKPVKRKAVAKVKASPVKKAAAVEKKARTARKPGEKSGTETIIENDNSDVKNPRKRKSPSEAPELSPPKQRRKLRGVEKVDSAEAKGTPKKVAAKSKRSGSETKISAKRVQKVSADTKDKKKSEVSSKVQIKKAIKTGSTKQTQKVQSKRSQTKSKNVSESEESVSPRKTRSVKTKASTVTLSEPATMKSIRGRKKSSPVVKRSTRRKV